MRAAVDDLGNWHTTLGAVLSTLAPSCDKFVETSLSVFGNGRHNAIIQVKLELGDADGNKISHPQASLEGVRRSIKLGNFDDTAGFEELGGGLTAGWAVSNSPSVFLYPPMKGHGDLPTINPSIYDDYIDDEGLYYVHFFVSYDETLGSGAGTFELGIEVKPKTTDGFTRGQMFKMSKSSGDDPYILQALKSLPMGVDDFEWIGTRVLHDGQSDEYIPPSDSQLSTNYFREISYSVSSRDSNTYSPYVERYNSRIFRCGIDDGHTYSPHTIRGFQNYSFGLRKNNFYSFSGYFWPYNVYKESSVIEQSAKPLVSPPANPDGPHSSLRVFADGASPLMPTFDYDPHKLNLTLYATFGFTSNNYDKSCPLDINIYDQYGHQADLAVDPQMLPVKYINPTGDGGLCSFKYFSTNTESPDDDDIANQNNVFGIIVAKLQESGTYRYIAAEEDGDNCKIILKDTPDDKLPAFDSLNLFRTYRTVKTSNSTLPQISYNMVPYQYPSVEWTTFGPYILTAPTIKDTGGWCLSPVWINNSFTIFYAPNLEVVTSAETGADNRVLLDDNPTESAPLEWEFIVCADNIHVGKPDKGQGSDNSAYNTPNPKSGRNSWVTINSLKMTLSGGLSAGYIYPNALNQAEIDIELTPADAKGQPLDPSQFPTADFVKSCIVAADYNSGTHFKREIDAPGWDYSFDKNQFKTHTATRDSLDVDYDSVDVVLDENSQTINIKLYITADKVTSNSKNIGLWIAIHDEVWGDPIIYTCKAGNSGGDSFNFNTYVSINLKNLIFYNDQNILLNPANDSMANRSDDWPVSNKGAEIDDNMWRLWNYRIELNGGIPALFFAVDTDRYSESTRCLSIRSSGVFTASAYIWPTGLLDMETLKPIAESSTTSFSVNSAYGVKVDNSLGSESGKLFLSLYWEFGTGDYSNTILQNYFTVLVYDAFGNTGTFNPDSSLVRDIYDEQNIDKIHPFNNGPAYIKNQNSKDDKVIYNLISKYSDAGESCYVNCVNLNNSHKTFDVELSQKTVNSKLFLNYLGLKSYQFTYANYDSCSLGAKYGDEDYKLFAGVPQSSRFDFYLRPIWNQKAFLIATLVPNDDTAGKGFAYCEDETPIVAELKGVIIKDSSFIWEVDYD